MPQAPATIACAWLLMQPAWAWTAAAWSVDILLAVSMSIVSFLIAVCMVGSGLTGGSASAPPAAVDQGASVQTDDGLPQRENGSAQ